MLSQAAISRKVANQLGSTVQAKLQTIAEILEVTKEDYFTLNDVVLDGREGSCEPGKMKTKSKLG